ncbi:9220_t:CDS:1, partial [Racocetra fulgida]
GLKPIPFNNRDESKIEDRLKSLEKFLEEHVINVELLKKISKKDNVNSLNNK